MNKDKINIRQMNIVSFFAALTVIGAFLSIPVSPVPISLQTLFTLLSGMMLGSKCGAISQLLYIFLGAIGLPVFSGFRGGLGILFGPTGGFLIGFVFAAYVVGKFTENTKKTKLLFYFIAGLLGTFIIYLTGISYFSFTTEIGIRESIVIGIIPFLFGDILKIIVASFIAFRLRFMVVIK